MLKVKQFSMFVLNALLAASFANAAADKVVTADELYQQAVIPYEQGWNKGLDLMWQAANAGNIKALCLIARGYQGTSLIVNVDAQTYFKKAAELGGLCGMQALSNLGSGPILDASLSDHSGDQNWTEILLETAKKRADEGQLDGLRSYALIQVAKGNDNGFCKWMEKAADLGDADAMNQLAGAIRDGCGWYIIPGSRDKAVRHWTEKAANHGNPRAMEVMSSYAEKDNDIVEMLAWLERAANTGNINSIRIYSTYLMGGDEFTIPIPADMQNKKKLTLGYMY
uniref:tetratricopeptide repeat protein n=1 Tax=Aeromonas jandaei TaxID=650 RepID=UPI003B9F74FD